MLHLPAHSRYDYSAIDQRRPYDWPQGKRLAFYVAINIEHFAFRAGRGADPTNRGGPQTTRNYAWRDYGVRVGVFRIFRMLDQLGLPATILLNSLVCAHYPEIIARIKARGDDVVGHGRTNAEELAGLWEEDEARIIAETTETIARAMGTRPLGWMGPGAAESAATPDLLQEAGYTHNLDWPVDDQPIFMNTRAGKLLSVPYPFELNDMGATINRDHTGREFADMIVDQFDEMVEQSAEQPLVMAVSLHGFIVGQPFRLRPLRRALEHCLKHALKERVWFTRALDIANYCLSLPPGTIPGG